MDAQNTRSMIDKTHEVLSQIGMGGAGEVYLIKNIKTNLVFAAKYARKDLNVCQSKKLMLLQKERDIMEELSSHPNILKSYNLFKKRRAVTLAGSAQNKQADNFLATSPYHMLEYCENGNFVNYLRKQASFQESIVAFYADQLLSTIHYIHQEGYAHLDIKLDNILLDDYFNIRLSDFGSAIKTSESQFTEVRRGTPKYMAPEIRDLKAYEGYDAMKADIYSFGVWIFLLLFKKFPTAKDSEYPSIPKIFSNNEILDFCPFELDESLWQSMSYEMRRILIACLNSNPAQRPSCLDIVSGFNLPLIPESIGDIIFEEMQARKSAYEQILHEERYCANLVPPQHEAALCEKHNDADNRHAQLNKSRTSTSENTDRKE